MKQDLRLADLVEVADEDALDALDQLRFTVESLALVMDTEDDHAQDIIDILMTEGTVSDNFDGTYRVVPAEEWTEA